MIDLYKASAGSGKTYTLSKTYLELLLKDKNPNSYRNILAVTFTNKATEEMKERILRDLFQKSLSDERAKNILIKMLHDYSAFSISTIDSFFQQALRAFAREIAHSSEYQIELDRDSLVHEAMDRLLDDMTEDETKLLNWFSSQIEESLQNGESADVESKLYEIGEEFMPVEDKLAYDKEKLKDLKQRCKEIIVRFHKDIQAAAEGTDTSSWRATPKKFLQKYLREFKYRDEVPAASLNFLAQGEGPIIELLDHQGRRWKQYVTAKLIEKQLFTLGLAQEFYKEYEEIKAERSVISIDESTHLLKDIIDGSDAPFVYERLGVRFQHFLLDEFQDTSVVQWENFRPLLANSLASGFDNIIVGDIKQSIYRFRNSDWKLLARTVGEDFPGAIVERPLKENWRSCDEIVNFNNSFFTKAAEYLGKKEIYKDVCQTVRKEDGQRGYITVDYCEEELDMCFNYVMDALNRGAKPSDICILVRGRNEGSKVAQMLLENDISVISDDSLRLKSSLVVRRLVSLLYCILSESDSTKSYLAKNLGIQLNYDYHSLVDLCEYLIRALREKDERTFKGQSLFIQSFMDDVLNFSQNRGNDLHLYLKHWEESDPLISSPDDPYSVRIMTIHKSKGLSAPVIIFPFAEKVTLYRAQTKWCRLDDAKEMGEDFDILYPISLDEKCSQSYFEKSYSEERDLQIVDNLNLFYVCCTRAEKEMHIIAKKVPKTLIDKGEAKDMSQLLFLALQLTQQIEHFATGLPYLFNLNEEKEADIQSFPASYQSFPMNPEDNPKRFVASSEAWDFFGSEGIANSRRLNGIRLHQLLSRITSLKDMDKVLSEASAEEKAVLEAAILSHREWFSDEFKCLNEVSVINSFGEFQRPDRVLIDKENRVTIIDFKFGEPQDKYHAQIRRYVKLFQEMGFKEVRGFLWYVNSDSVEEI